MTMANVPINHLASEGGRGWRVAPRIAGRLECLRFQDQGNRPGFVPGAFGRVAGDTVEQIVQPDFTLSLKWLLLRKDAFLGRENDSLTCLAVQRIHVQSPAHIACFVRL